jgi:hypothetical protein
MGTFSSPRNYTNKLATSNQRATRIALQCTFRKLHKYLLPCIITRISGSEKKEKLTTAQNKYQVKIELYLSLLSMFSFCCSKHTFTKWFQWNFISELRQIVGDLTMSENRLLDKNRIYLHPRQNRWISDEIIRIEEIKGNWVKYFTSIQIYPWGTR